MKRINRNDQKTRISKPKIGGRFWPVTQTGENVPHSLYAHIPRTTSGLCDAERAAGGRVRTLRKPRQGLEPGDYRFVTNVFPGISGQAVSGIVRASSF